MTNHKIVAIPYVNLNPISIILLRSVSLTFPSTNKGFVFDTWILKSNSTCDGILYLLSYKINFQIKTVENVDYWYACVVVITDIYSTILFLLY